MNYICAPFPLYDFARGFEVWRAVWFVGHVGMALLYLGAGFVGRGLSGAGTGGMGDSAMAMGRRKVGGKEE
jgi:hypothetical protein